MSREKYLKSKFDFSFQFKIDLAEGGVFRPYWSEDDFPIVLCSAEFFRGGQLTISAFRKNGSEIIRDFENITGDYNGGAAWVIFHKFATFEDILDSIDLTPWIEIIDRKEEFSQYQQWGKSLGEEDSVIWSPAERAIFRGEPIPEPERETKLALELIRDAPHLLSNKEYQLELWSVLNTANYSLDEEERKAAVKLLQDHLIPKRRKELRPANFRAIKEVMVELARHLARTCKKMRSYDQEDRALLKAGRCEDDDGREIERDRYENLKKWAHDTGEFRISRLSSDDLDLLIKSPTQYVNQTLLSYLNNISLRTATG